jgi:hypothetical protein
MVEVLFSSYRAEGKRISEFRKSRKTEEDPSKSLP